MPRLEFRRANEADVPQLNLLVNSAYRGEASKAGWTTEADLLDGIRINEESLNEMLLSPSAIILMGLSEGKTVACVYLQKQQESLYLGMLTVAPKLQDKGFGKQLLRAAEEHGRETGCHSIIMTVITERHELIEWYERQGYYKTEERRPFPSDPRYGIPRQPIEFLVMKKDL